ncbi:mitochondrial endonuclease family, related to holliday junction resolvases, implicated in DNA or tRNA metabolism [Schizosaccharomyces pombe]|uniref:Uncharacterized protein C824.03c, mitochondrial n=1 Tax=Schizosaccharomyces pombe (strain 972 / ATCC 24843) TaxID=284812 RepID=YIQ3_SCHPO|nr:uncharacterized protein SPAC824.03c [Schizosaccharomyces pombe]Q9UT40.1 RecName: Full=Uncharacterized protein C824.03c, mitochondrial [Schizosaccharomyces pombe 972h-]CAB57333.1 conserved fungal protein [Schizosaccharomyces pombe]|eukprot:NP_593442.1 uncharacterized protein SPAC824.03c [Schizosaccharomyces pombe]
MWILKSGFNRCRNFSFMNRGLLGLRNLSVTHNNLVSYLEHLSVQKPSTSNTVAQGTLFEYLVQYVLKQHSFQLERCGGKGDGGVDLVGQFSIKNVLFEPTKVVVSCKSNKGSIGPRFVRELEGSLSSYPTDTLGILACLGSFTSSSLKTLSISNRPLALCRIYVDGFHSYMFQFVWNHQALAIFPDLSVRQIYKLPSPTANIVPLSQEFSQVNYVSLFELLQPLSRTEERPVPLVLVYKNQKISLNC